MQRSGDKPAGNAYNNVMYASKIFFFMFLAFTIVFMVIYSIFDKESIIHRDERRFIESWNVVDADGNTFETGRTFRDNKVYNGDFTVTSKLPDNIYNNQVLCFSAYTEVSVFIGGEKSRELTIIDDSSIPGGHVKSFYVTIPLYDEDSGQEIKIVRNTSSGRPEVVPETFVTTVNGVYAFLFERYGFSFCFALVLLAFSLIVIFIGLGLMVWYRQKMKMLYGALGVFIVAAWLVTNSFLYPFTFGHYHVDGIANYMFCLLMPFGFILYVNSVQRARYKRIMSILLICCSINTAFWTVLHFTGIQPFNKSLVPIDIVLGILVLTGFIILIVDIKKGNFSKYKYTVIGFLGFLVFCTAEIYVLMFMTLKSDDLPMLIGLAFLLVFVVIQQVDDLKKIYEEKQRAVDLSDAKTKFLASMSHEIRTPINSILGMNEIILKENKDEVIDQYAKTVRSSGRMLLTLVNDVLDFSKIEAGKMEILEEEYSFSRVLSETMPMLLERAENKSLLLKTHINTDIPDGQIGDESRLKQILVNIISNAIKYTDKGSIDVTLDGSYTDEKSFELKISVKDTGRGIKKDEINTLFDAFARADRKQNSSIEGTGLGLTIVKSIVDSMGGEITVDSEYGKGSEFRVTIPVGVFDRTPAKEDYSNKDSNSEKAYVCDYTSDARILAVDDNNSNLTIVRLFLKDTGIDTELCSSGLEAVELCKKNKYDLILLDHMMPDPDGMETLKLIKNEADSLNKDTKVIVLTANAVSGSREMYMAAGFTDYLVKPMDSKKLIRTVKKYLPEEKVHLKQEESQTVNNDKDEYIGQQSNALKTDGSLKEHLLSVLPDMDYDNALLHCAGDEDILAEILTDFSNACEGKINDLKSFMQTKDYKSYLISVHAIKGNLATVGLMKQSERAKKHEFAVKEDNISFILEDFEGFIAEYKDVSERIAGCVKG